MSTTIPAWFQCNGRCWPATRRRWRRWTRDEAFGPRDGGFDLLGQGLRKLTWTDQYGSALSAARPNQSWPGLIYGILIMVLFFGIFLGLIEISVAMVTPSAKKK